MNLITNLYEFRHRWSGNNIENPFCIRPNPATTIDASEVEKKLSQSNKFCVKNDTTRRTFDKIDRRRKRN